MPTSAIEVPAMASPPKRKCGRQQGLTSEEKVIAANLKDLCTHLGVKQAQLAAAIGTSYQQIFKYQSAINRMSCGTLYRISEALGAPIAYFFEGVETDVAPIKSRRLTYEISKNLSKLSDDDREAVAALVLRLSKKAA